MTESLIKKKLILTFMHGFSWILSQFLLYEFGNPIIVRACTFDTHRDCLAAISTTQKRLSYPISRYGLHSYPSVDPVVFIVAVILLLNPKNPDIGVFDGTTASTHDQSAV